MDHLLELLLRAREHAHSIHRKAVDQSPAFQHAFFYVFQCQHGRFLHHVFPDFLSASVVAICFCSDLTLRIKFRHHLCPGKPGDHSRHNHSPDIYHGCIAARQVFFISSNVNSTLYSSLVCHQFRYFPHQRSDLTIQLTHTRLAGIRFNHMLQHSFWQQHLIRF